MREERGKRDKEMSKRGKEGKERERGRQKYGGGREVKREKETRKEIMTEL